MEIKTKDFNAGSRRAVKNVRVQQAAQRATANLLRERNNAAANLPEWEELRNRAREIKAHTIERLDDYLALFADSVEKAGGKVVWASTAQEAADYVVSLAKEKGIRTVVKGKSMATEEIDLNHKLEEVGVEAIETDLGEYMIQLAGETPYHIIAPAIHKTRQDFGQLFSEHLSIPYEEDPQRLTQIARHALREKFSQADMGVTGANFGIAETGTIVLVENEGNQRLSTSLPPIHVSIMGMEKVIPTLQDLSVFLALLPRSATGQKASSYVSLITGPRAPGEIDGPEEFHMVILDNGRRPHSRRPRNARVLLLHPLCRLPEHMPRLQLGRRSRLRLGVLGPYWLDYHAGDSRDWAGQGLACRIDSVRGVQGCLPHQNRHPPYAPQPPTQGHSTETERSRYKWRRGPRPGKMGHACLGCDYEKQDGLLRSNQPRPTRPETSFEKRISPMAPTLPLGVGPTTGSSPPSPPARLRRYGTKGYPKMPPTSREAFLTTVRRSLGRAGTTAPPSNGAPYAETDSSISPQPPNIDREQLISRFAEEVKKVHGVVTRVSGQDELSALLGALVEEKGIRKIVRWDTPALSSLDPALTSAGAKVIPINLNEDEASRSELRNALIDADMGLTEVDYAVADIGSLVLRASGPQSRLASVLPPIHVAVVASDRIVASLAHLLPLLNSSEQLPSAVALVTGPSRTADIETIRTVGIHGPVELHVVILDEA